MKKISVLLIWLIISFSAKAQIEHPGTPMAFDYAQSKNIKTIQLGELNVDSLIDADAKLNLKNRIGIVKQLNIDFKKEATLIKNDTIYIWVLKLKATNALAMNVYFDNFELPEGAKLFVYNPNTKDILGAITKANNKVYRKLSTRSINGDEIVIELQEPAELSDKYDFTVESAGLKYKAASGDCEVNINCPEGDDWQIVKHAVAKIEFKSGIYLKSCSGSLIANTKFNSTPFFLTANHCIGDNDEAQSAVFYFNYEGLTCTSTTGDNSQTVSGATFIASGHDPVQGDDHLDFTLLLLTSVPPASYYPFYAGWSRIVTPPDSTTTIHHPAGDIKKISKDYDPPVIGSYTGYDDNSHWNIKKWDLGTTEGGSSGGPLFDTEQRIIGDLTGGLADCDDPVNDYFQRFDLAWDKYTNDTMQLKAWLDSAGINPAYIDGYDPYSGTTVYYPPVDFGANIDSSVVRLHWLPPGSTPMKINDNFESYTSFALQIPNWTMVDLDNGYTWGIEGVDFPNKNYVGSFIVFDWNGTDPANLPGWQPHSGNKCLACFGTQPPDNPNNDWLISPIINIDTTKYLVFYAKSVSDLYNPEIIRVGISQGSNIPEDFEFITPEPIEIPTHWKRYVFDLSEYKGSDIRFAINVISDNAFALLIDDIAVTSYVEGFKNTEETDIPSQLTRIAGTNGNIKTYSPKALSSYLIYKDRKLYAEVPDTQLYYVDNQFTENSYYYVVANYEGTLSLPSDGVYISLEDTISERPKDNELKIYPNPSVNGNFTISFNHFVKDAQLYMFDINGKLIFKDKLNNVKEKTYNMQDLNSGFYILEVDTNFEDYIYKFINIKK